MFGVFGGFLKLFVVFLVCFCCKRFWDSLAGFLVRVLFSDFVCGGMFLVTRATKENKLLFYGL